MNSHKASSGASLCRRFSAPFMQPRERRMVALDYAFHSHPAAGESGEESGEVPINLISPIDEVATMKRSRSRCCPRIWTSIVLVLLLQLAMAAYFLLSLCFLPTSWSSVQDPSVLPRPPMGFNNWARFMCDLNQTLFTDTADAMVETGLLAAGYNRINLDDCWLEHSRSSNGSLVWNSTLFPEGLIWLGEYLHDRGFKYGIYQDAGNLTCGGYPGSKGYEEIDAATFTSWGIDYVKLDGCNVLNNSDPRPETEQYLILYEKWHEVLSAQENPLVFSESAPAYFAPTQQKPPYTNYTDWYTVMEKMPKYGELARHSDDIKIYGFNQILDPTGHWESILNNYDLETLLSRYQSCGFYNDPDFLIPFPDLNEYEKRSQFSLWASFSAPLIISAYIPELPKSDIEYLSNKEIIAVDQDGLCQQATLVSRDGYFDVLSKSLENGDRLLTVLNRGESINSTSVNLERVGLAPNVAYNIHDLWTGERYTESNAIIFRNRDPHSTAVLRISAPSGYGYGQKLDVTPTGMIFNTFSGKCLTVTSSGASFQDCVASDEQVWKTPESGFLIPLSHTGSCLTAGGYGSLRLGECDSYEEKEWKYYLSGNLEAKGTGSCLAKAENGDAILESCRKEFDGQVVGMPVGVVIH